VDHEGPSGGLDEAVLNGKLFGIRSREMREGEDWRRGVGESVVARCRVRNPGRRPIRCESDRMVGLRHAVIGFRDYRGFVPRYAEEKPTAPIFARFIF